MKIDLHTHSNFSDGTDSPTELMHEAQMANLDVIALTDHDTIAGWDEAIKARRGKLNLVLGAEISCLTENGESVHMSSLLFDKDNEDLQKTLSATRDDRLPRLLKMIELLNNDGIEVTIKDVESVKAEQATLGRPHLADALVIKGVVKNRDEAFEKYLSNGSKYYVAHSAPTPIDVIKSVKAAGGVTVIAHPFSSFRGYNLDAEFFAPFVQAGLNGIEVDHRDQNPDERRILREIANELDLCITGSSDYHGMGKLNLLGENTTAIKEWERLESLANARRVINV